MDNILPETRYTKDLVHSSHVIKQNMEVQSYRLCKGICNAHINNITDNFL